MIDPTQRGDEIAAEMRDFYEAHRPLRWWQRRRRWTSECADNLMLGLLNVAQRGLRRRRFDPRLDALVAAGNRLVITLGDPLAGPSTKDHVVACWRAAVDDAGR